MTGSGKKSDQQRTGFGVLFFQQLVDCRVVFGASAQTWAAIGAGNFQGQQDIEVTIDQVSLAVIFFDRRLRIKVRQVIQRTARPA